MARSKYKIEDDLNFAPYRPLDPRKIYDDRAAILASKASGIERLVYRLFGSSAVASIAFAIDPLAKFRTDSMQSMSAYTRKVYRVKPGIQLVKRGRTGVGGESNYRSSDGTYKPRLYPQKARITWSGWTSAPAGVHQSIPEYRFDTTDSSRPKANAGGPLEIYKNSVRMPGFSIRRRADTYISYPDFQATTSSDILEYDCGPLAYFSRPNQTSLLNAQKDHATSTMNSRVNQLVARCLPRSKQFDLFRSIGELRDFAHLTKIENYPEMMRRRTLLARDAPDLFLSYEFGLAPLISDLRTLISLPSRVTKKLNLLLSRSGKPTSYRTIIKGIDGPSYKSPGFVDVFAPNYLIGSSTAVTSTSYETEVRCAVNATFEFPPAEVPILREELTARLYGIEPSIKAIYDLIPWSWLIDWFTGFGSYLNIIESINGDPSLINYGFVTYKSVGTVRTQFINKWSDTDYREFRPAAPVTITYKRQLVREYEFVSSFQRRVSVGTLGVASALEQVNLSSFQSLIIGALLAQRSK